MCVWPAIVTVPWRELVLVLAATEYVAVSLPLPLLPVVIQDTLLDTLQRQPTSAVTLMLPLPPADGNKALGGESEKVQGAPF